MSTDDEFAAEASARDIEQETLSKLREHQYGSRTALLDITEDIAESLGLSSYQQTMLLDWVCDVRRSSDPYPVTQSDLSARKVLRGRISDVPAGQSKAAHTRPTFRDFEVLRRGISAVPAGQSKAAHTRPTFSDLERQLEAENNTAEFAGHFDGRTIKERPVQQRRLATRRENLSDNSSTTDKAQNGITAEKQERLTDDLVHLRVSEIWDIMDHNVMDFKKSEVNIAVCGRSGTGKSSLINCIHNLKAGEDGAARVGVVESIVDPLPYKHPGLPGVVFWDIPGVGTDHFQKDSYLERVEFSRFDAFIIVTSDRIFQEDTWLAKEAHGKEKPFYFVRSRLDQDVANAMSNNDLDEETALRRIRDNTEESLTKNGMPRTKVYLVSGLVQYQARWDFPILMEELIKRTPKKNVTAMVMAMVSCSTDIIVKKKEYFTERIPTIVSQALQSQEFYKNVLLSEMYLYIECFGITEAGLRKWEVQLETLEPKLRCIKHDLETIMQSVDDDKMKHFFWKLSTHPLFKKYEWAKRLARKTEDKFLIKGYTEAARAWKDTEELIRETTRHTLEASLEQCELLAVYVLQEKEKVARKYWQRHTLKHP